MELEKNNIINIYDYFIQKYSQMPKLYDVFLSHKQAEAQDRAKVYKLFLKQHKIKAFYDKDELTDDDWTLEKLIEVVSRSKALFFFYTPTILDNLWCQLELLVAIKAKMPIYIINVEPTWPLTHVNILDQKIPDYLKSAFTKNNIIIDHRYEFDSLEKEVIKILKPIKQNKTRKNKKK